MAVKPSSLFSIQPIIEVLQRILLKELCSNVQFKEYQLVLGFVVGCILPNTKEELLRKKSPFGGLGASNYS
jgi:hypothetical protein